MKLIKQNDVLQAHPEFLNEQIDDHDKAIYAKGWNDCSKEYYNAITELPVASMACTDLSTRLRRAFEADELVNQRLLLDAADAIEELLEEKAKLENSGKLLVTAFDRLKEKVQKYRHAAFVISETCVEESKCHISPEEAIKKIRGQLYYGGHRCELPPHGDLIDRDTALSHPFANGRYDHENANEHFIFGHESYKEWLEDLPVIVPASEEVES